MKFADVCGRCCLWGGMLGWHLACLWALVAAGGQPLFWALASACVLVLGLGLAFAAFCRSEWDREARERRRERIEDIFASAGWNAEDN